MNKYLIASVILFALIIFSQQQIVCPLCFDINGTSLNFTCNGKQCQAFYWPNKTISSYLIDCKKAKSYSSDCYYNADFDNNTQLYKFVACNYSLSNCGSCNSNTSCQSCYLGFTPYVKTYETNASNCRICSDIVPGCQECSSDRCEKCQQEFLLMSGLCYQKDGKTLAGMQISDYDSSLKGIQIALILLAVFGLIGIIIGGYVAFIWVKKQKYQPLLQHPN